MAFGVAGGAGRDKGGENGAVDFVVAEDAEGAALEAARRLADVARRGGAVALAGGSTPRRAYELAASLEPDWSRAEVWLGDERCVPPDDARSNLRLVRESLLDRLERPPVVHPVPTDLAPDDAAAAYAEELSGTTLELVLLGLGMDGHTASLFPRAPSLDERHALAVAAPAALDPWVERVTLTIPALSARARGRLPRGRAGQGGGGAAGVRRAGVPRDAGLPRPRDLGTDDRDPRPRRRGSYPPAAGHQGSG